MKKIQIFIILGLILISGCAKQIQLSSDCQSTCKNIPFCDNCPEISQKNLDDSWYYGNLDQKKPGTPDNWIHILEGTRSAGWFDPNKEQGVFSKDKCDCKISL